MTVSFYLFSSFAKKNYIYLKSPGMKILRVLPIVILLVWSAGVYAQTTNSCGFIIPKKSMIRSSFKSVYEAADIVKNMLDSIKWKENFTLQEQNGINNAYATIIRNKRWIVYDNHFLENLDAHAATKWASISVLAHEMGHHYYNHVVSGKGSTIPTEIEADAFSGYVMNKQGATLAQSIAAMQAIASDKASATHPAKKDRIASITRGWNMGNNEKGNNSGGNTGGGNTGGGNTGTGNTGGNTGGGNTGTNTDPATDPSWIALGMQSNKTETVYLSDDGRNYQPAQIKAGELFVFKFEIYNYGWLRLPYYNGQRVFKLMHGRDYNIIWNRRTKNWTVVQVPE
jgi:Peptidase family M48